MTRLPDDTPEQRPSSAISFFTQPRQRPNLPRLPDEIGGSRGASGMSTSSDVGGGNTSSNACGQSLKGGKASLTRMQPEAPVSPAPLRSPTILESPNAAAGGVVGKPAGMRERFNKPLTVSTSKPEDERRPQVIKVLNDNESIRDYYLFDKEIYSGGAKGKVLMATKKEDNTEVIVKIRAKRQGKGGERVWRAIMSQMHDIRGNHHVLDISEILEDESSFYVVMPKCNGGELFDFLVTETEVSEAECKRIVREILTAVGHLHKSGLVHRDVKPENIMFNMDIPTKTPKSVKLIDFDTCMAWIPGSPKSTKFVGTPGYIAPEALLGEVSPQSDLWSVGVILYILMTGETPWSSMVSLEDGTVGSPSAKQMYKALKEEVLEWDREPWTDFPKARDLCQHLMAFNTEERVVTVEDAFAHPWLTEE